MRWALLVLVLAGCWSSSAAKAADPAPTESEKTVARDQWTGDPDRVGHDSSPPPRPPVQLAGGDFSVAGCNTGCNGCAIGHATDVHGIDVATGAHLWPDPMPKGAGYSCSALVPVGAHLQLVAKSGDGLVIDHWKIFRDGDYCPCAGTNAAVCDVVVTKEITAKFARVYCGADWKPQGAAQIGH